MTNIDFFYSSQFTTNNDHLDNGHKQQNRRQPETGIMKSELLTIVKKFKEWLLPKLQLSLYKPFRSSFKTVYVFAEKAVL